MSEAVDRRVSDAERQRTVAVLRDNAARGLLSLDELEDRIALTFRARTASDLQAVVWDLQLAETPAPRQSIWQRAGFRYHAAAYVLTNAFLVGTWAITTPHALFWPFFPAMGWGVGLGVHGVVAHYAVTHAGTEPSRDRPGPALPAGPPPPPALPRTRYVAVMFADVTNSTGLTEAMGDAEWRNVRARHLALVRTCVQDHAGEEVSCQGDGLFARFRTPADAAACAVELQRRIHDRKSDAGFSPSVRIGLHAGEVVEEHEDLLGHVVNVAARVTGEAAANQILCTESVADRLGANFELEDCGLRTLKGVSRPRHLLAVVW